MIESTVCNGGIVFFGVGPGNLLPPTYFRTLLCYLCKVLSHATGTSKLKEPILKVWGLGLEGLNATKGPADRLRALCEQGVGERV